MTPRARKGSGRGGIRGVTLLLLILFILTAAGFAWSYSKYYKVQRQITALTDPNVRNELDKQETDALLAKVSRLIVLPKNEDPVVATIQDVELLASGQDFYKDAKNGQKLIIFSVAQKAIIYDEEANVIVNVGPVIVRDANGAEVAGFQKVDGKINIEIRNGTAESGKATTVRDQLKRTPEFIVVRLGKAANTDYSNTVVVDLTGGAKTDLAKQVADALGVEVSTETPVAEKPSAAEVLVVVGSQ